MSFTASNIPLWSGNGYELTNGISIASISGGGGGSSGSSALEGIFLGIQPSVTNNAFIISNIPTTYKHLHLSYNLRTAASSVVYLLLSQDNGVSFGASNTLSGATSTTHFANIRFYNTGFSGSNKYMETFVNTTTQVNQNIMYVESSKTGLTNCIKIFSPVGWANIGPNANLFGIN